MAQRPEDFSLPLSAIKKILMDSMPKSVTVTDAAVLALSKAACVFILYVTTSANAISQDNKRKRVMGKDILDALEDLDLKFLIPKLNVILTNYHRSLHSKKQAKEDQKQKDGKTKSKGSKELIILDSDSEDKVVTVNNSSENSSDNEDYEELSV